MGIWWGAGGIVLVFLALTFLTLHSTRRRYLSQRGCWGPISIYRIVAAVVIVPANSLEERQEARVEIESLSETFG